MWTVKASYLGMKVAIAYAGGREKLWSSMGHFDDSPLSSWVLNPNPLDFKGLIKDLEELQEKVRENTSAEILDLKVLLQETLDAWRDDKNRLKKITSMCFHEHEWPRLEKLLGDGWMELTAGEIFGEKCPLLKGGEGYEFGIRPVKSITNCRDLGQMTSDGFITSNFASWTRSRENRIMKAVLENHPELVENIKVLLEPKGNAFMEGGDVMCLSEDSLAMGIGSHSTREAAVEVSKALPKKTVYAVLKYPEELRTSWMDHYGKHLNYMFSMVDEGKALVAPYVFDYPKGSKKTLMSILKTLSDDLYKWEPVREESDLNPKNWPKIPDRLKPRIESRVYGGLRKDRVEAFRDVGKVEIYKGGKLTSKKDSFIQALIEDEVLNPDGVTLVGGDPGDVDYRNEFHHWITAIREGGWACCVLTVKPGIVVAYYDMFKTNEALEDQGVKTISLDGRYAKLITNTGFGDLILPLCRE